MSLIEIVICRTQTIGMKMFKELLIQRQRTEAGFLINSTIPIVTALTFQFLSLFKAKFNLTALYI